MFHSRTLQAMMSADHPSIDPFLSITVFELHYDVTASLTCTPWTECTWETAS